MFQEMFMASKGKPISHKGRVLCMVDEFEVGAKQTLRVVIEGAKQDWRQAIELVNEGMFVIGGRKFRSALVLWADTAPPEVVMVSESRRGSVQVRNVWDMGDGVVHSWHNGGAMIVEEIADGKRFRCNDGRANDDFDDPIVRVERVG